MTYRYLPDQQSLFTQETEQYDRWLLREILNNSIAHANYQLGGRIYVNELEEHITVSNPGDFLPENVETVFALDKVQKNIKISKEDAAKLRSLKLVEGRYPNIYLSYKIANIVGQETEYVKKRGLANDVYRQLILNALEKNEWM